jgi:hypothetical protein
MLSNGSRVINDDTYDAVLPMLAAAPEGRIILMSTPYIAAGFSIRFVPIAGPAPTYPRARDRHHVRE